MRLRAVVAAAAAALVTAPGAVAATGLEIGMEDERLLLSAPEDAPGTVAEWVASGVDSTRIHARWGEIAPRVRPAGFDAANPSARGYDWTALDRAVGLASAAGLRVMLTVTGPGPLWTSRSPARRNPRWRPHAGRFAQFAAAVARRYGKSVDRYLIWNEPNQAGWLEPQLSCSRQGRPCTPVAPHVYRGLLQAALPAIKAADPGAEVVAGELAPIGSRPVRERAALAPLPFLRAMACVDERYRALPRRGECAGFRPVYADAVGHHPHGVLNAPDEPSEDRTWAKIADLSRLFAVLDRLTSAGRLVAPAATGGRFVVHLTEFGYQTSPPDHAIGVSHAEQAAWLQQAAYIAWRHPRVRSLVHYQWRDEPVRFRGPGVRAYAGWQSGLHYVTGEAKPALASFHTPLASEKGRLWGQVRPGGAQVVALARRSASGTFQKVADVQTDPAGYFVRDVGPGEYRFTWTLGETVRNSGVVTVGGGTQVRPSVGAVL